MGRLRLGLASGSGSLEPVERRVGSATLCTEPGWRVAGCLPEPGIPQLGLGRLRGRVARSAWRKLLRRGLGQSVVTLGAARAPDLRSSQLLCDPLATFAA